jgi:coenzyme F420-reducing hydrogenase delta subunit
MYNMSAAMSQKFAETIIDMTERLRKLGPSPLRKDSIKNNDNGKEG